MSAPIEPRCAGAQMNAKAIPLEALVRPCDPAALGFKTTDDLPAVPDIVGQDRAVDAVAFGIAMAGDGYNVYASGPEGTGKRTVVQQFLTSAAAARPLADDWGYVFNFADPRAPRALRLPAGRATDLRTRMADLLRELSTALRSAFETDEYRARRIALEESFKRRRDDAIAVLEQEASGRSIALIRTPVGFGLAPIQASEIV